MLTNICDTLILSPDCREHFLPLGGQEAAALRGLGVQMAGISALRVGYQSTRMRPAYHVILATTVGHGTLATSDGEWELAPGTMVVLPAGSSHSYRSAAEPWELVWFHLARRPRWRALEAPAARLIPCPDAAHLANMARVYTEEASVPRIDVAEFLARALARTLCRLLAPRAGSDAETEERMRAAWREVERDLRRRWTENELAALAHYSPQHFRRLAHLHWGAPPLRAVARARLDRAAMLLEHTTLRAGEIAAAVGYDDPFAFSTAFRRVMGLSPRAYRASRLDQDS